MLQSFKDKEGFIENIVLSRSTIYFKIALYKCLKRFKALKNSSLSLIYFRNNFRFHLETCSFSARLFPSQ